MGKRGGLLIAAPATDRARSLALLGTGLFGLACAPSPAALETTATSDTSTTGTGTASSWGDEESGDSGETGETSGVEFDPLVCGSWDDEDLGDPMPLPAESPCPDGGPCPSFTNVTDGAGIQHQQYLKVSGSAQQCIFHLKSGEGIIPFSDCEPQWFTGGAAAADVDGDGWDDLIVTRLAQVDKLYMNQGDGTFVDEAQARGLGECSFSNGVVFGDIDNDGDQDLLVSSVGDASHHLFINDGEGFFTDDADARGFGLVGEGLHSGEGIGLGDYDLDGWLDAHINEWVEPHNYDGFGPGGPAGSRLLHNLGDGVFEDLTEELGVSLLDIDPDGIYGFSTSFADLDGDRFPELVVAADFRSSRMFWNEGGVGFLDGTDASGLNKESNAMGSTLGDFDGDGLLDWFVTSIAEREECDEADIDDCPWKGSGNRLYHNDGGRTFSRAEDDAGVRDAGWAWGSAFFDFDNDADLDLMVVNGWPGRDLNGGFKHQEFPMRAWTNDGSGVMTDSASLNGAHDTGQGRAIVPFDYDRDGDIDVFIANHAQEPVLYRNDGGNGQAWLQVEVEGVVSNRDGRGAVVEVQVELDGPIQRRQVGASSHFLGEPPLTQHFGLGPGVTTVAQVRVYWPASDSEVVMNDVAVGQRIEIIEDP
jgi:hypothetical protein